MKSFLKVMKALSDPNLWQACRTAECHLQRQMAVDRLFCEYLGVLLVKWFRVKANKVLLAAVAVLSLAILFRHEPLISFSAGIIALVVLTTTTPGETESWFLSTWDFTKQIMPLLFAGVLVAGLLPGRPGSEGLR